MPDLRCIGNKDVSFDLQKATVPDHTSLDLPKLHRTFFHDPSAMGIISLISTAALLLVGPRLVLTAPATQSLDLRGLGLPPVKRQGSSLSGYLGAFFLGDDPDVYFYLSDGNDATSFSALNDGDPVLVPTVGTGGVRDPAIVQGGGDDEGRKWYIVGTDLDISKVSRRLCSTIPWAVLFY